MILKIFLDKLKYNSSHGAVLARGALGAFVVVGIVDPWREGDKAAAAQRQQELAAGHVLQSTIWLGPIPLSVNDPGYMLSTLPQCSLIVDWIGTISSAVIVLFLMVMGNRPIVYQKEHKDACLKFTPLNHLASDNMYRNPEVRFEFRFIRGDKVHLTGVKKSGKNFDGVEFDCRIGQKLGLPYIILRSRPV